MARKKSSPIVVKIAGAEWTVRRRKLSDAHGVCYHDRRVIEIDTGTTGVELWKTIIHEAIHASVPDLAEEAVSRLEIDIAETLNACKDWLTRGDA